MMKVLTVFYASITISALAVEDGLRGHPMGRRIHDMQVMHWFADAGPIAAFVGAPSPCGVFLPV
jgi:hypothetical protein